MIETFIKIVCYITSNWSRRGYCHGLCLGFGKEELDLKVEALIYERYGIIHKGKSTNTCQWTPRSSIECYKHIRDLVGKCTGQIAICIKQLKAMRIRLPNYWSIY